MSRKGKVQITGDGKSVSEMFTKIKADGESTETSLAKNSKGMAKGMGAFTLAIGAAVAALYVMDKAITQVGEANKILERRALATTWLDRTNKGLADAVRNTAEFTQGQLQARDAIFMMNEATLKGIKMNGTEYKNLMQLSSKLAVLQGKEVKEIFEGFTIGVARLSPLIQENTGITLNNSKVLEEYAKKHGLVAASLDDETKKQIILNKMIEEGKKKVADLTDFDLEQGLIVSKQYSKYLETKAQITDAFYGKLGEMARNYAKRAAVLERNEEAERNSRIILAKKKYLDIFETIQAENENLSNLEIADQTLFKVIQNRKEEYREYYQDVAGGAAKLRHLVTKEEKKLSKELQEIRLDLIKKSDEMFEAKLIKNKWTHRFRGIKRDLDLIATKTGLKGFLTNTLIEEPKQAAKKRADWWKKNKTRVLGERAEVVRDIIKFEKEKLNFNELSNVEQIKLEEKFQKMERDLINKSNITKLKMLRLQKAKEADIRKGDKESIAKGALEAFSIAQDRAKKDANIKKDLIKNFKRYASMHKTTLKEIEEQERETQRKKDEIAQRVQSTVNITRDVTMDALNAVLEGNAAAIPRMLAQKAFLYGTDTLWKGVSDVAIGYGYLANPVTALAGPALIAAGKKEIGVGAGLMTLGGIGMATLPDPEGGASKSEGSSDRIETKQTVKEAENTNKKLNLSLYPSEKESIEKLQYQIKKKNKSTRNGGK